MQAKKYLKINATKFNRFSRHHANLKFLQLKINATFAIKNINETIYFSIFF